MPPSIIADCCAGVAVTMAYAKSPKIANLKSRDMVAPLDEDLIRDGHMTEVKGGLPEKTLAVRSIGPSSHVSL